MQYFMEKDGTVHLINKKYEEYGWSVEKYNDKKSGKKKKHKKKKKHIDTSVFIEQVKTISTENLDGPEKKRTDQKEHELVPKGKKAEGNTTLLNGFKSLSDVEKFFSNNESNVLNNFKLLPQGLQNTSDDFLKQLFYDALLRYTKKLSLDLNKRYVLIKQIYQRTGKIESTADLSYEQVCDALKNNVKEDTVSKKVNAVKKQPLKQRPINNSATDDVPSYIPGIPISRKTKKPLYGYARDYFGRVKKSNLYDENRKNDFHQRTVNQSSYDYSNYDSNDDHDGAYEGWK